MNPLANVNRKRNSSIMFNEKLSTIPSPDPGSFANATAWLASLLTGSIALTIGGLAIAVIGVLMLEGRFPVQRSAKTLLGCFLLFSVPYIVAILFRLERPQPNAEVAFVAPPSSAVSPTYSPSSNLDPYAGAAVPTH